MKLTPRRKGAKQDEIPPVEAHDEKIIKYRECQKNHAAKSGGHVLDGCQEFVAYGEEGAVDALKCAICECHRNFHRKEVEGCNCHHSCQEMEQISGAGPQPTLPAMTFTSNGLTDSDDQEGATSASDAATKKRIRSHFSAEQKEKMASFAESLGWKIQRQDERAVETFCTEIGVMKHAFKAWMKNSRPKIGRKDLP